MKLVGNLLVLERGIRLGECLSEFRRVMGAVMIQDMRTRFGHSLVGYLIAIAWPLSHIGVVTLAFLLKMSIAPVGDSPTVFVSTAIVPYILCLYTGRLLAMAIPQNRQLLNIPVIRPVHLILSRCILEMLNAMVVLALFIFIVSLFDVDLIPEDITEGAKAIGAAVFLGIGLGFFNAVMCMLVGHFFLVFFTVSMIGLYLLSGIYLPPSAMPEDIRQYMAYNPLLQLVEWLRSAYFASYDADLVNKPLILWVGGISLTLGLAGERFLRGKFFS
jgi:capsular polysaccharide transport system permease protein